MDKHRNKYILTMNSLRTSLLFLLFLAFGIPSSFGVQYLWNGAVGDSSWSTVSNWQRIISAGVYVPASNIPLSNDTAVIANTTGVPCRINNANVSVGYLFVYNQTLFILPGRRLTADYVYINNDLLARIFAFTNTQIFVQRDWYNMNFLTGFVASSSSRVLFTGPNRSIISGWTRFWDVTISKDPTVPVRTRYQTEFNNTYGTMLGLLGTPFPIQNTTNFTKLFIQNDLTIDQGVLKVDMCHVDTVIDFHVVGNININNNGGLNINPNTLNAVPYNLPGLAPSGVALPYSYNARLMVMAVGRNYRDNNAPFPPSQSTGLWFATDVLTDNTTFYNRSGVDSAAAPRPIIIFNGSAGNQTILGQYPLPDNQNTLNQGNGLFFPTVIINKPAGQKVQMICAIKVSGNMYIRSGELETNGYNVLFGDKNRRMFEVRGNGIFRLNSGSKLLLYSSNADGGFFKAIAGGTVYFTGTSSKRVLIARDAQPGQYYQIAFYTGSKLEARYADFNMQGASNNNFVTNSEGTVASCATGTAASPCFRAGGGLKMFNGAILDPLNLGNNFSDCSFSGGQNDFTALMLNVDTPTPLNIQNVAFNGTNQGGTPATVAVRNCVSNNTAGANPTVINFQFSSGLVGGEELGEIWDDGQREAFITWFGANRAEWIGSVSTDWSNAANWSTTPNCSCVPGSPGYSNFYIIVSRETAQRDLVANSATMPFINITSSFLMNYTPDATPVFQPRNVTFNNNVNVTIGKDVFNFGRGDASGITPGILTFGNRPVNIGGNFLVHDFGIGGNTNTFTAGTSTVVLNGSGIQQVRMGAQSGTFNNFFNLTVDKPSIAQIQNNLCRVRGNMLHNYGILELFTSQPLTVDGTHTMNAGAEWIMNSSNITFGNSVTINDDAKLNSGNSTVTFNASAAGTYTFRTNDQRFFNITFNGPSTTTYNVTGDITALGTTNINANNVVTLNGHPYNANGAQTVKVSATNINGRLNMRPFAQLLINSTSATAANRTLTVGTNGRIDIVGSPAGTIKVSRDGISGFYTFTCNGSIRARYVLFEFMDVNGINCSGSTAARMIKITAAPDTSSFSDCVFTNGSGAAAISNNSTYLWIPQDMSGNVYNATFPVIMLPTSPAGVMASNVKRTTTSVTPLTFIRASGSFHGTTGEWDPNNNIDWQITALKKWSGQQFPLAPQTATDWNNANNWSPVGVPTSSDDVILDHTIVGPQYTVNIPAGGVNTRDLIISTNYPVSNPIFINVNGNITVNGFFTCSSQGYLYIPTSTPVLTFRRSYSNTGRISNGLGQAVPNRFVFDGQGINVISMTQGANYPFFDVSVNGGQWELNSNTFILRDLTIASGASLDASIANYNIDLCRNFICNGTFIPRFGRVSFTDFTNTSVNLANYSNAQSIINGTSGLVKFFDLRVNKFATTTNHVTLTGQILIGGVLDLQQRNLIVSCPGCKTDALFDNLPIIDVFGSWSSAGPGSFVDGRLGRTYVTDIINTQTFPIGKGNVYVDAPELSVALTSQTTTVFTMEVYNNAASEVGRPLPAIVPPPGKVLKIANRYYSVKKYGGGNPILQGSTEGADLASGTVKLYFASDTTVSKPAGFPDGMTNLAQDFGVIQDNDADVNGLGPIGTGWNQLTTTTSGDFISGSVLSSSLFPITTFGNGDITVYFFDIVLPVQLFDFKAQRVNEQQVNLVWNSSNERNLAGYKLFRSIDRAANFEPLASYDSNGELLPKGGTEGRAQYTYVDRDKLEPGRVYYYRLQAIDADGTVSTEQTRAITTPSLFTLNDVFPNPFDESATVPFILENAARVTIDVYDIQGRKVYSLLDREMNAGYHKVDLDATSLPSGIYNVQFRAGDFVKSVKVVKAATH
jgi:hypothetical protein